MEKNERYHWAEKQLYNNKHYGCNKKQMRHENKINTQKGI